MNDYQENFHNYLIYLKKMVGGLYVPFLQNEWNENDLIKLKNINDTNKTNPKHGETVYELLKKYYGPSYNIFLTNSGRSALLLILKNLDLKKSDEIIIPSYSCLGLIQPILKLGLKPYFVDINNDLGISFKSIKKAINKNTKVIIIPHLGGSFSNDTFKILELAKKKKILAIEDGCQSLGLEINKKAVGTFSDISFFSFGEGKPILSSGGGYVLTKKKNFINDTSTLAEENFEEIMKRVKLFKEKYSKSYFKRSMSRAFTHLLSLNKTEDPKLSSFDIYKFNEIEEFLLLNQLKNIDKIIESRRVNANIWKSNLLNRFKKLNFINHNHSIYNKLYIFNDSLIDYRKYFIFNAIEVEDGYKPLHLRYDFKKYPKTDLINTNLMWKKIFSLPTRPSIKNDYLKNIIYNLT
jgi:dTDP-4-amino-4,6-dideoxygalactose transaminase